MASTDSVEWAVQSPAKLKEGETRSLVWRKGCHGTPVPLLEGRTLWFRDPEMLKFPTSETEHLSRAQDLEDSAARMGGGHWI